MSVAKATEALSKKDSEKTEVEEAIEGLKDLSAQGFKAKLQFSVFQIDGLGSVEASDVSIKYDISPAASIVTEDSLTGKAVKDVVKGNLKSKDVKISLNLELGAGKTCYSAEFSLKEVSDDKEYRDELIAKPVDSESEAASSKITVHIKILYDKIDSLLESKNIELEQVEKELKTLGAQVRDASKKKAPKKKEQAKSPKKKATKKGATEDLTEAGSMAGSVFEFVANVPTLALTHRAFVLFGVAAVGIFVFGDEASV